MVQTFSNKRKHQEGKTLKTDQKN